VSISFGSRRVDNTKRTLTDALASHPGSHSLFIVCLSWNGSVKYGN